MRPLFGWSLVLSLLSLSNCTAPPAESAATVPVATTPRAMDIGQATSLVPGPDTTYRRVLAADVLRGDTVYAATLPVLNDADGAIRIRIWVNPQAHKLEETTALFTPHRPSVTYKQLGQGIGKYEPTTGHYYFITLYQTIRQLANGRTEYGSEQQIGGWVQPGSTTAAVAHHVVK